MIGLCHDRPTDRPTDLREAEATQRSQRRACARDGARRRVERGRAWDDPSKRVTRTTPQSERRTKAALTHAARRPAAPSSRKVSERMNVKRLPVEEMMVLDATDVPVPHLMQSDALKVQFAASQNGAKKQLRGSTLCHGSFPRGRPCVKRPRVTSQDTQRVERGVELHPRTRLIPSARPWRGSHLLLGRVCTIRCTVMQPLLLLRIDCWFIATISP